MELQKPTNNPFALAIDITEQSLKWRGMNLRPLVEDIAVRALSRVRPQWSASPQIELSIVLTDDDYIQELNARYRGKDKPTDILSFPGLVSTRPQDPQILGDVILSFETSSQEALSMNVPFEHYISHLILHGVLHLLGYDHENERDAQEMEGLEIDLLAEMGIENPYQ